MNVINLEIKFLGGGVYTTSITNLLGNFSLEDFKSEKFKSFLFNHLKYIVDYGDDGFMFEEDLYEGYVFLTVTKARVGDGVMWDVVKSYYQPLI